MSDYLLFQISAKDRSSRQHQAVASGLMNIFILIIAMCEKYNPLPLYRSMGWQMVQVLKYVVLKIKISK